MSPTARDHARIRLDLGADEDYRALTSSAQWLYQAFLIDPSLNFLGVCDWRPARIARKTAELTALDVETFRLELEVATFILADDESEEVLIRSFVKHDGLMKSPNMVKAMVKAYGDVSSSVLRAVAVGQLIALRDKAPDLCWNASGDLLERPSLTFDEGFEELSRNPSSNPSGNPSRKGSPTPILLSSLTPRSTNPNLTYESARADNGLDLDADG